MSEVAFAKTFLASVDARPRKLSPDHVEDPRSFPARAPTEYVHMQQYILPRAPKPMSKPTGAARPAPGQEPAVAVTIRALRGAGAGGDAEAIRLPAQPASTSLLDIKSGVAERLSLPPSRVRLLHRKKPVADSKVLKDLLGPGDNNSLELSVMVMGGGGGGGGSAAAATAATSTLSSPPPPPPAAGGEDVVGRTTAGGPTGLAVVEGPEFWNDLRGFLLQRVRDEKVTDEVFSLFLRAWEERS